MLKTLMITTAVSGLMIGAAAAQTPQPQQPASPPAATGGAPGTSGGAAIINSQGPGQWLSSSLIGVDVLGPDNEKVGDIADILFDQNGNVVGYIVGIGGVLGMGTKNVALAPSSLQMVPSSGMGRTTTGSGAPAGGEGMKLKTNMSKDQLKAANTFESRSSTGQPTTPRQ